ncbi:DUF4190 domain-containing protein [Verrucomicrobiales bacterium]|nr:DUF4190 domain-containing protein [Verrucomicrobiales bacterium]MDA7926486.1 DUF4190 domain-containing protein [Verrucomicrobiales bacterium]
MSSEPSLIASPDQPPAKVTPRGAVWSLILGILSLFCLWILGSIPAIILGCLSIKKAKANPTTVGGEWLALAGVITGAIGIFTGLISVGIVASIAMPAFISAQVATQGRVEEVKAMQSVRQVALASVVYATDHPNGELPETLDDLIPDFLSDDSQFTVVFNDATSSTLKYRQVAKTAGDDEPILLLKLPGKDNYLVGYRDGSVLKHRTSLNQALLDSFGE